MSCPHRPLREARKRRTAARRRRTRARRRRRRRRRGPRGRRRDASWRRRARKGGRRRPGRGNGPVARGGGAVPRFTQTRARRAPDGGTRGRALRRGERDDAGGRARGRARRGDSGARGRRSARSASHRACACRRPESHHLLKTATARARSAREMATISRERRRRSCEDRSNAAVLRPWRLQAAPESAPSNARTADVSPLNAPLPDAQDVGEKELSQPLFAPLFQRGVRFQTGSRGFDSIGGTHDLTDELTESLELIGSAPSFFRPRRELRRRPRRLFGPEARTDKEASAMSPVVTVADASTFLASRLRSFHVFRGRRRHHGSAAAACGALRRGAVGGARLASPRARPRLVQIHRVRRVSRRVLRPSPRARRALPRAHSRPSSSFAAGAAENRHRRRRSRGDRRRPGGGRSTGRGRARPQGEEEGWRGLQGRGGRRGGEAPRAQEGGRGPRRIPLPPSPPPTTPRRPPRPSRWASPPRAKITPAGTSTSSASASSPTTAPRAAPWSFAPTATPLGGHSAMDGR